MTSFVAGCGGANSAIQPDNCFSAIASHSPCASRRYFGARRAKRPRRVRRTQRARARHRACHQHLRCALVTEIAISETHAGNRSAEAAIVALVEIEARFERNTLDGGTDGLAADLQGIAGQSHAADRTLAAELDRPGGAEVVEHPACTAGAVETAERKHLASHKPAGFIGIHHSGQRRHNHRPGRDGPQHQTRKHAATPTY
jgi:hypothetical protein